MKTLKITISITATFFMLFLLIEQANAQLEFVGNYADGMGGAGWNANGSGPEPYGDGHGDIFYYTASRDYVDGADYCGAALTDVLNDFPVFGQSIIDNGYSFEQVTLKLGLANLGDDLEGIDYFTIAGLHYCNFYPVLITIELDGEALVEGTGCYSMYISGTNVREFQSGFVKFNNISCSSSGPVQNVAAAFLEDMANEEVQVLMELSANVASLNGNGRSGAYINVVCTFEKGLPTLPVQGLHADNEGAAAWDADGTGPEPFANGHQNMLYYCASVDYDDINPSPDACLAHFLEGSTGFINTMLQLQYRGYDIGDLKVKMGLASFGPDVEGEDWGVENGHHWVHEYNNVFTFEINGEPILYVMQDTMKMVSYTSHWKLNTSVGKVYDISENASTNAQFVAKSFLRDLGTHYLEFNISDLNIAGSFSGNGRIGAFYQISEGKLTGVHEQATFVSAGEVNGIWTAENSPYYVEGHVNIEDGQTLTIEPGVRVGVRGPYHFTVQGCLNAEGTAGNQIMFTASNPNITWDGIDYDYTPATNDTSVFQHCIFKYSSALGYNPANSGGVFAVREFNKLLIDHSIFHSNKALIISGGVSAGGGAIALWTASPVIRNNEFRNNHSMYGGAIFCYENSNPEISRNLFYNNSATSDGGALDIWGNSNPNVVNNTFSLNNANSDGGAVDIYSTSNPVFVNNIFWGNTANSGNQISITTYGCNVNFFYNDIEGGQTGIGPFGIGTGVYENNIDADPEFVDLLNYDFHILESSPCHNTGDPTILDPDGTVSDMGYCFTWCTTSVDESIASALKLTIYPNPLTDNGVISYEMIQPSMVKIEICNNLGQIIAEPYHAYQLAGQYKHTFYAEQLQPGIYMLRVTAGQQIYVTKFIKY
jgi:hypothetical protein